MTKGEVPCYRFVPIANGTIRDDSIYAAVSRMSGQPKPLVKATVDMTFDAISEQLKLGHRVEFPQLGLPEGTYKFCVSSRNGLDPTQYGVTVGSRNIRVVDAASAKLRVSLENESDPGDVDSFAIPITFVALAMVANLARLHDLRKRAWGENGIIRSLLKEGVLMADCTSIRKFKDAADYRARFVVQSEIDKYLPNGRHFVDDARINSIIAGIDGRAADPARVREIVAKAESTCETLEPEETAALMQVTDPELFEEMRAAADRIKHKVYDNRIVMFAPLYMSNLCVNGCRYCGFREGNAEQKRRVLTMDELREELDVLAGRIGHKRLIAVYGEHPATSTEYIAETIETCYSHAVPAPRTGRRNAIRRVNVNAAPLPVADLKVLRSVGIGTFQVFQETYNRKLYEEMHPAWSVKGNYDWRTTCFHRCMEAGVDDVGLGVLYGLCDWRYELLATVMHARDLERWFNIGPHTLSFPRLEPASGTRVPEESPWLIDDDTFARILVIARLSVPYTGMIVTARESRESRNRVLDHGMTQLDCSSNIAIKGYSDFADESHQEKNRQQFLLGDTRSIDEMVRYLAERGTITSFCTAGYRCGRTGGCIMDALKTGREGKFCKINAVLTFREWLDDFASDETRRIGDALIEKELAGIREWLPKFYPTVMKQYEATCRGERDLFF